MKGKIFVCLYSLILIGLFGACCYLMTIVNPPPLPENDSRRYHTGDDFYSKDSLLPHDNPDYGLEKIPERVDADEFRDNFMTIVPKYDIKAEKISYEPGKRVVPPIWPSDEIVKKHVEKQEAEELNPKELETYLPVKGHRRSVNDKNHLDVKKGTGSILFKILDDSGHKKMEIKFISGGYMKTKKQRNNKNPNQLKSNVTCKKITQLYQSTEYKNDDDVGVNILNIGADDVILLHILDDSDILVDKSDLPDTSNIDDMQEFVTDVNYLNKTWNNVSNFLDLAKTEKILKELLYSDMNKFSLLFNSDNRTTVSRNLSTQQYNSDSDISTKVLHNLSDTSLSTEPILFNDYPDKIYKGNLFNNMLNETSDDLSNNKTGYNSH